MSRRLRNLFIAPGRARLPRARALVLGLVATLVVPSGCGLHLHHPRDAATADSADGEFKASRLVDGFAEEFAQSKAILADEIAAAQAWAEVGRDRDLLDVLAARDESDPEVAATYFPRCQARFGGDGWTTLCSKISARLFALTGFALPFDAAPPPPPAGSKAKQPPPPPARDQTADVTRIFRNLQRHWKGPQSVESQLARAASEYELAARALRLEAPPARCPLFDPPGRAPALAVGVERQRALCKARRDNLGAIERGVCHGQNCGPGLLGRHAADLLAVHDALAAHHDDLTRRLYAYEAAKHPCTRPEPAPDRANSRTGPSGQANMSSTAGPSGQLGATSGTGPPGQPTCDEAVLRHRFAALGQVPVPAALVAHDLAAIARLGRLYQLGEQLAALDALIEERERATRRRAAADDDPAAAEALAGAPRFARALHATIVGIDRLRDAVDTFELAILVLIRETLRVEQAALDEAVDHAERRIRVAHVKLAAQLDEAVHLLEAHAGLLKLERAGCTQQGLVAAHESNKCRDEVAKSLLAFGNAWTLGRAAQRRADALDLGVRHDASIGRSRAAMAMRQVYLAAGVTELVKFNKGGLAPEALAQLVVSTVGFGIIAAGVWAR